MSTHSSAMPRLHTDGCAVAAAAPAVGGLLQQGRCAVPCRQDALVAGRRPSEDCQARRTARLHAVIACVVGRQATSYKLERKARLKRICNSKAHCVDGATRSMQVASSCSVGQVHASKIGHGFCATPASCCDSRAGTHTPCGAGLGCLPAHYMPSLRPHNINHCLAAAEKCIVKRLDRATALLVQLAQRADLSTAHL